MTRISFAAALLAGAALFTLSAQAADVAAVSRLDVTDLGRAPAATPVRLALTLAYRDQAGLERLVAAQATPGSAAYHRFLSAAEFAERFSASVADHARVIDALQRAGLQVERTYPNRTVIDVVGSAAAVAAYFGTDIHLVSQVGHGVRYANVTAAHVPAELAGTVHSVVGLDNLARMRTFNRPAQVVPHGAEAPDASGAAQPIERKSFGAFAGLYPGGVAAAYHFPSRTGSTGTGHAIAVVIDSDILNADLTTFWKAAKITRTGTISRVLVEGTNPGVNGDEGETAIDVETTSGLAPGADIAIYLMPSLNDQPIEDAYNQAVSADVVDVVSSSFGGCELDDTPFATATESIAQQGAAEGITFTASTGDAGGFCRDATAAGKTYYAADIVNIPASDPHFVGVGGTTLQVNPTTGARTSETAWGPGGANGGGGGGVSSFWALPDYQTGVSGIAVVPTITAKPPASQPNSGFAGRNLPDISMDASNATGSYVAVYAKGIGGWTGYGGTSVANPIFAALVAEQNQKTGARAGYLNPALYATFTNSGASPGGVYGGDFLDVTSGSIGAGWSARAGYDQATGLGTVLNDLSENRQGQGRRAQHALA